MHDYDRDCDCEPEREIHPFRAGKLLLLRRRPSPDSRW